MVKPREANRLAEFVIDVRVRISKSIKEPAHQPTIGATSYPAATANLSRTRATALTSASTSLDSL